MNSMLLIGSGILISLVIATAFLLARKAEQGVLAFREDQHESFTSGRES